MIVSELLVSPPSSVRLAVISMLVWEAKGMQMTQEIVPAEGVPVKVVTGRKVPVPPPGRYNQNQFTTDPVEGWENQKSFGGSGNVRARVRVVNLRPLDSVSGVGRRPGI